jgi:hypothetical protein
MKAIEIQAPNKIPLTNKEKVFLGGSIEQGKAIKWQKQIITTLKDEEIMFLNPRRDNWDSSLVQSIDNPEFCEQVDWELKALELSDLIVMFIDPNTLSPISLMEIGLHARSGKMIVCCPEGFWRKGNVDIVGQTYGYPVVTTIDELIEAIKFYLL